MQKTNHSVKKSTSRIPPLTVELQMVNEVQTFTSGMIGPWTERAVALLRTLASATDACDGFGGMPAAMEDGVLEDKLDKTVCEAMGYAREMVARLAVLEASGAPQRLGGGDARRRWLMSPPNFGNVARVGPNPTHFRSIEHENRSYNLTGSAYRQDRFWNGTSLRK
jgi:hypothetical protein